MSAILDEYRARLREALAKIEELDGELVAMENERSEPVAIIGTACRIPGGGSTPAEFYRSLENGVDAIGEVPPEDGNYRRSNQAHHLYNVPYGGAHFCTTSTYSTQLFLGYLHEKPPPWIHNNAFYWN